MSNIALVDEDSDMITSDDGDAQGQGRSERALVEKERVTAENELRASRHRDRMQKKAQLQILKDNVTVLALNLKTMLNRGMQADKVKGAEGSAVDSNFYSLATIDTRAIQAVIAETAEMISMLREERLLSTIDDRDEVSAHTDRLVATDQHSNNNNSAADKDKQQLDEAAKVSAAASTQSRNESMMSLPQLQSLPDDSNIEEDIKDMDEYVQAMQTNSNATQNNQILLNKLSSYENYSILNDAFILKVIDNFNAIEVDVDLKNNNLDINSSNFNPIDPKARPSEWTKIKLKRVYMKEFVDRLEGSTEEDIVRYHESYLQDEEEEMVREVTEGGRLTNIEAALSAPQYASLLGGERRVYRKPGSSHAINYCQCVSTIMDVVCCTCMCMCHIIYRISR